MSITGHERVQWTIEGQRFEQVAGFLTHESQFFDDWFCAWQEAPETPAEGEEKHYDVTTAPWLENSSTEAAAATFTVKIETSEGKKCFFFNFTKVPKLSAEWMGAMLVFLRRGRATYKWDEMEYETQLSFSRLVTFLGLHKFTEKHGKPSKQGPMVGAALPPTMVPDEETGAGKEVDSAARLAMAQVSIENYRDERGINDNKSVEEKGEEKEANESTAPETTESSSQGEPKKVPSAREEWLARAMDDENLTLAPVGCFFCGSSGSHSTEECPYKPK